MTAVGLGQQGSQAVGSGFESLPCQKFLRFIQHFSIPKINETLKGSFTKFFGTVRQKYSTENTSSLTPPPLLSINCFDN